MSERRGPKALELWCRRITDGYPGVNVQNMTTSWRDGLAFCAMIHHFRPDLIDFNSLNKDNVYGNNELAFRIAEQHLGIPALLDAEDMASCSVPDRLSILTYLSQFYQHFGGSSPSRLALSRSPENTSQGMTPVTESPQPKVMPRHLGIRREPCAYCKLPVFLAEKLVINHKTYHRTCFKCERCNNQLTIGNYYETEDGDYCCETCPDEDNNDDNNTQMMLPKLPTTSPPLSPINDKKFEINPIKSMTKSLSDEEKTRKLSEIDVNNTSLTRKMRLNFMSEQLDTSSIVKNEQLISTNNISIKLSTNDCVDNIKLNDTINTVKLSEISDNLSVKNLMVCKDTKETLDAGDDADYSSQCLNSVHETMNFHVKIEKNEVIDENELIDETELIEKNQLIDKTDVFDDADGSECVGAGALEELDTAEGINEAEEPKIAEESFDDDSKDEINLLNAEGVDLSKEYPEEMNPFNSDDDEETDDVIKVKVQTSSRVSTNPFGSEDEEEEEEEEETPTPASRKRLGGDGERVKRRLEAPQINLNPFWSDDDDEESDRDAAVAVPVPKPRTIRQTPEGNSSLRSNLDRSGFYASSSSLASTSSTTTTPGGTYRKRKPAPPPPPPPVPNERVSTNLSDVKSPQSSHNSPIRTTPRPRKSKPAPPPPLPSSLLATLSLNPSPISWEDEKISKNQSNKSKQSHNTPPPLDEMEAFTYIDKSTQGKWKRKKGPAPALPIPQKRKIKVMSLKDVKLELDEIEVQQQGLEKQGVRLEQLIRDRCENVHDNDDNGDRHDSMTMDVEELVLELFSLVNEKNELFRRQAELMLLKRQQRLEEEHADVEYQIRCLMLQPEAMKTDFDKQREETLIQRLVEIVERRSEIVECLEMDRKREVEEDKSINWHMGLYAAKSKGDLTRDLEESPKSHKSKKFKIKEIIKDKHSKKIHKKDADKDVDETEVKLKRQNKKKWF